MGIFYTGIDTDWFKVFLGAMMLVAVLFNNFIRRQGHPKRNEPAMSERHPFIELRSVSKHFRLGHRAEGHLA